MDITDMPKVTAKFSPRQFGNLKPGAIDCIGKEGEFHALWQIEEGPYAGQIAFSLPRDWEIEAIWVPSEDLIIQKIL
ncbi:hypothetical protein [Methylobacterium sp. Leaf91]|uniref:hypothetical protein n=1 Tax=Methylobacterium sp. Leaf91 TaxID=1736247 RepID=UPI0012E86AF0|nr:hypothetical protein [Methylobacterium sp. Leaf91]